MGKFLTVMEKILLFIVMMQRKCSNSSLLMMVFRNEVIERISLIKSLRYLDVIVDPIETLSKCVAWISVEVF
jgi:hypothetical protein